MSILCKSWDTLMLTSLFLDVSAVNLFIRLSSGLYSKEWQEKLEVGIIIVMRYQLWSIVSVSINLIIGPPRRISEFWGWRRRTEANLATPVTGTHTKKQSCLFRRGANKDKNQSPSSRDTSALIYVLNSTCCRQKIL